MKGNREDALERDLSALYRSDRELFLSEQGSNGRSELIEECASACERELTLEASATSPHMQLGGFLFAQVRFTRSVVWTAFAFVALLTAVAPHVETEGPLGSQVLSAAGGLTALRLPCERHALKALRHGRARSRLPVQRGVRGRCAAAADGSCECPRPRGWSRCVGD